MTGPVIRGAVLNSGAGAGAVLALDAALSFWGGFDPATGTIIDQHHPQAGHEVGGRILVLPHSRGSAGTPAGLAEALRLKTGPAGIILAGDDVNIAVGAMVAGALYHISCPVIRLEAKDYACAAAAEHAAIAADGAVRIQPGATGP